MKLTKIAAVTLLASTFATSAFAASPSWNYVEAGYAQVDDESINDKAKGFKVAGAYQFADNFVTRVEYSDGDTDISGADVGFDLLSVGLGYRVEAADSIDFYGIVSYERLGVDARFGGASASNDESGFGATIGLRSMFSDNFEGLAELGYIDIDDAEINDVTLKVGGRYFVTEDISVGATYRLFEDFDMVTATVRYSF